MRARFYAPGIGRFLTSDTWEGKALQPMSSNVWNYVQSNPINYTDPTGHIPCWNSTKARTDFAEQYVSTIKEDGTHYSRDQLATYTAAGIGVQCYSIDRFWPDKYQGVGIGQITDRQTEEAYGMPVYKVNSQGEPIEFDENNNPVIRGYGLRCYIYVVLAGIEGPCVCKTPEEMRSMGINYESHYQLEPTHNPTNTRWAVTYMRRRIQQVIDNCRSCSTTDKFIAAALGQNGSGLHPGAMWELSSWGKGNPFRQNREDNINWTAYFNNRIIHSGDKGWYDTSNQINIFSNVVWELEKRFWYVPAGLDRTLISDLASIKKP